MRSNLPKPKDGGAKKALASGVISKLRVGSILATVGALLLALSLPRPIRPTYLPSPSLRLSELYHFQQAERQVAQRSEVPLPVEVRVVGELVHRFGAAEFAKDASAHESLRDELEGATRNAAERYGGAPLLSLRALQASLFIRALQHPEEPGSEVQRVELGGGFLNYAERRGIYVAGVVQLSAPELRLLFYQRWNELTGLNEATGFALEWQLRAYLHRLELRYPEQDVPKEERLRMQLIAIDKLSRDDVEYPAHFARGVVLSKLGHHSAAFESFRTHLKHSPEGKWSLMARNYVAYEARRLAP